MYGEHVQRIIGRAVTEPAYRALLFHNPDNALVGYPLTDDEIVALKGLVSERFDALAAELEQRISRAVDMFLEIDGIKGE